MKKLIICICFGIFSLVSLFQVLCLAMETNRQDSDYKLVGSQWRLIQEKTRWGHTEYLLVFLENGKMIFANTFFNDEWEVHEKNVELRLNRDHKVHKYNGKFIDRNHITGTTIRQDGIETEWDAYRQERNCFETSSFKSNLILEICMEAETVGEKMAIEPYLTPWKNQGRNINYAKGFSLQSVHGTSWLMEQNGNVMKLILSVKSNDSTTKSMPVPLLSDVVIKSKDGGKQAGALCYLQDQLIVEMKGDSMEIDIYPNETIELLYYVPMFHGRATIDVKDLGSSKVFLK